MDTERNTEFLEILKERLTEQRLYHSICVAKKAKELAFIYLVIFIIMFFTGAGKYSVDAMIRKAME